MAKDPLTVDELADYCRTQAGLLSGHAETIGEEADDLLDEIDADISEARAQLEATPDNIADLETLEGNLEEKQAIVETKSARMSAFQDLAADYLDLADELERLDDWETALQRIVTFEKERDAPAYFDRTTMLESVAEES